MTSASAATAHSKMRSSEGSASIAFGKREVNVTVSGQLKELIRLSSELDGADEDCVAISSILRGPSDPEQTSVSRDDARLYIANEDTGKASVLEIGSGRTIAEFEVGGEPEGGTTARFGLFS